MGLDYHVAVNDEREGPLTQLQVRDRIDRGELAEEDLGWHRGLDEWKPLSEFVEFEDVFTRRLELPPLPEGGEDTDGLSELPPGEERPAGSYAAPDSYYDPEDTEREPFRIWTRVAARVVDSIVLFAAAAFVCGAFGTALMSALGLFFPFVVVALTFVLEAGLLCSFGTTPGKALLGVTVRSPDGQILSWASALRRSLLVWLRGVGLGHLFFASILMTLCYLEVKRKGDILWDREQNLRVTYSQPKPFALGLAAAIVLVVFLMVGQTYEMLKSGEIPLPEGFEPPEGFPAPASSPVEPGAGERNLDGYPSA